MSATLGSERRVDNYTTVGVVGHIDHGKTSLVAKLTGVDTDTHPEEKRRGITIDLGFAALTHRERTFAFIDAPGHQKYVGNLLAGVSAVDMGLLVVAGDQGIQEQTLEHVAILRGLGVPELVVVISRIDLCTPEQIEELSEELEVFLTDFGYTDFPVIQVSSQTGEGIEQLVSELDRIAAGVPWSSQPAERPFRMPIDRVLNVPGRGLVVAGTPWTGKVSVGETLQVAGQTASLRVREIEIHGEQVDSSLCGRRTAINLVASEGVDLKRGHELVATDSHPMVSRFAVQLETAARIPNLRCPCTAQLHTATTSLDVRLLGPKQIVAKESCMVLVETTAPIVATLGQACLFRLPFPVGAIGGGRVVASFVEPQLTRRKTKDLVELANAIHGKSCTEQLQHWVHFLGEVHLTEGWCREHLSGEFGPLEELTRSVLDAEDVLQVSGQLVSTRTLDAVQQNALRILRNQAGECENAWVVQDALVGRLQPLASSEVIELGLSRLLESQGDEAALVVKTNGMYALASDETQLSKKQRARMVELLRLYEDKVTPPSIKEVAAKLSMNESATKSLLRYAAQQGVLIDLACEFFINAKTFEAMQDSLRAAFAERSELSVPDIKELWGVTRKHVIPLLEYCDAQGITTRESNMRRPGSRLG
jgi:selenocysteine-specific elongation factor